MHFLIYACSYQNCADRLLIPALVLSSPWLYTQPTMGVCMFTPHGVRAKRAWLLHIDVQVTRLLPD